MTVSTEISKNQYNGNGSQDTFPYTFKIFNSKDLVVVYTDADGNDTTWTEGTQYTVTNAGEDSGGNVIIDPSYIPQTGTKLTIYRQIEVLQGVDYVEGDSFLAETNEEALDRLTFIDQQQDRQIALCLKAPESDDPSISLEIPISTVRANKYLMFNPDGTIGVTASTSTPLIYSELDARYYTQTVLDGGQLDNRYYTESEIDTWRNGTTQTEMGYVHGVTSDIQTQINDKIPSYFIKGYIERPQFTYNGDSEAYTILVDAGAYMCKDKLCYWDSQLTMGAMGSPAADTWYYLYISYSSVNSGTPLDSGDFIWSTTVPTWNNTYHQWMNGDDRCIFAVRTNGTPSNILEFFHDGDLVCYADYIRDLSLADVDATFIDVALTIPGFTRKADVLFYLDSNGDTDTATGYWITKGQTGITGHFIGYIKYNSPSVVPKIFQSNSVITDSNQTIQVKYSTGGSHRMAIYTNGWYLPQGM